MSEDTEVTSGNADLETGNPNVTETRKEYSDVEKRAIELGWVPQDEYNGDPDRWKSAEVFVALDEPIRRIESQSRELKAVKQSLDALKQHYSKVQETEYNRALAALKNQRKQALVDGDIDKFEQLEDQIDEVRAEAAEIKQNAAAINTSPAPVSPEFQNWVNRNPWYASHRSMALFADEVGLKLHSNGVPRDQVLKQVEEAVRKEFPQRFTNPNKNSANTVEAGNGRATPTSKSDGFEMNEQEKNIMNTLIRSGTVTKEQYIADLKKVKGLK